MLNLMVVFSSDKCLLPDSFCCKYLRARLPIFTPQLISFDEIRSFFIDPSNQPISENSSLPVNLLILHAAYSAFCLVFNQLVNLLFNGEVIFHTTRTFTLLAEPGGVISLPQNCR
jgi:hypothetical protein